MKRNAPSLSWRKFFMTITAICPVCLVAFFAGCTTEKIKDYQPTSSGASERTVQQSGLEAALDPFVEKSRTEQYFDIDAVGKGIAILHVRVTNKSADQTFLVKKESFHLLRKEAGELKGNGKQIKTSTGAANALAWGGLVVYGALTPAAILTSMGMVSRATEVQRNFTAKELGDQTLSPRESMEGFVYFTPVQKREDWSRVTVVKIIAADIKTQQPVELTVPLSP